jgi:hypothetical protein
MKILSPSESRIHNTVHTSNSSAKGNDNQEFKKMTDQLKKKLMNQIKKEKDKNCNCSSANCGCARN